MQIQVTESAPQRRWKLITIRSFMIMGDSQGGGKWKAGVYSQVEICKSALRLQRELKNELNYLVPILLAAQTLRLQINTAKFSSRADETLKTLAKYILSG